VAIIDPPAGVLAAVAAIAFVLALTQAKKYRSSSCWSGGSGAG
jgi:hypothetical protein